MLLKVLFQFILIALFFQTAFSEGFSYTYNGNNVIGVIRNYKVRDNESLIEIARRFGLGYNEIVDANPELDPFLPGKDQIVTIPTMWILPEAARDDIVINLSEMRLYYYIKKKGSIVIRTYPIGIGDDGTETPLGIYKITEKKVNPSWYVPKSIKKQRPELPDVVPPGPENPLGSRALRLSNSSYLIHGTNRPWAVGRKVTHGCIRLYPEDIIKLYDSVTIGTIVKIVREPVKVGVKDGKVYIEVHKDDESKINYFNKAVELLVNKRLLKNVDLEKLYIAIEEKKGIPIIIS
jgi:L,D-transpeptidase ErfK/SrfK